MTTPVSLVGSERQKNRSRPLQNRDSFCRIAGVKFVFPFLGCALLIIMRTCSLCDGSATLQAEVISDTLMILMVLITINLGMCTARLGPLSLRRLLATKAIKETVVYCQTFVESPFHSIVWDIMFFLHLLDKVAKLINITIMTI